MNQNRKDIRSVKELMEWSDRVGAEARRVSEELQKFLKEKEVRDAVRGASVLAVMGYVLAILMFVM